MDTYDEGSHQAKEGHFPSNTYMGGPSVSGARRAAALGSQKDQAQKVFGDAVKAQALLSMCWGALTSIVE